MALSLHSPSASSYLRPSQLPFLSHPSPTLRQTHRLLSFLLTNDLLLFLTLLQLTFTLFIRLHWRIFTHNSITLSFFLSLTFITLPLWLIARISILAATYNVPEDEWSPSVRKYAFGRSGPWNRSSRLLAAYVILVIIFGSYSSPPTPTPLAPDAADLERYFIAANLYNVAPIFDTWSGELISLIDYLGPENVMLSVYESHSSDGTKGLLKDWRSELKERGVSYKIRESEEIPRWWSNSEGRIEYMMKIRNKVLEPLGEMKGEMRGRRFTKVIFLNDVIFEWRTIARMLLHNSGNYTQICSFDYAFSGLYDLWVLRDRCGSPFSSMYPYTLDPPTLSSIRANEPFRVQTCWNGITAFNAEPFLPPPGIIEGGSVFFRTARPPRQTLDEDTDEVLSREMTRECHASECFLLPYDIGRRVRELTSKEPEIWIDPRAIVTYDWKWWTFYRLALGAPVVKVWVWLWERRTWEWEVWKWIWWKTRWPDERQRGCKWWTEEELPADCPRLETGKEVDALAPVEEVLGLGGEPEPMVVVERQTHGEPAYRRHHGVAIRREHFR